ncbi:MAG: hypothetical protein AAFR58_03165 [Cyanobacteria bacterium J06627_28]
MTTVEILPVSNADGKRVYRAISGDKHSVGETAGQALDALTVQLEDAEFSGLFVIRTIEPDNFFTAEQQARLSNLMELWRKARDQGHALPLEQQTELDLLVENVKSHSVNARNW